MWQDIIREAKGVDLVLTALKTIPVDVADISCMALASGGLEHLVAVMMANMGHAGVTQKACQALEYLAGNDSDRQVSSRFWLIC